MLLRERFTNDFVVCELKAGTGAYEVGGQIFAYSAELAPVAAAADVGVGGMIITGMPNDRIETQVRAQSARTGHRVDWYCYQASFTLEPMLPIVTVGGGQEADRNLA